MWYWFKLPVSYGDIAISASFPLLLLLPSPLLNSLPLKLSLHESQCIMFVFQKIQEAQDPCFIHGAIAFLFIVQSLWNLVAMLIWCRANSIPNFIDWKLIEQLTQKWPKENSQNNCRAVGGGRGRMLGHIGGNTTFFIHVLFPRCPRGSSTWHQYGGHVDVFANTSK